MFSDANDGGFFNETSGYGQGSTPKAPSKGDAKRVQNVLPVTTYQIRNSSEGVVRVGDVPFYLITLVGRVKSVDINSLKVTYFIEDDRGIVEAVHWIEQEGSSQSTPVVENVVCRVHGSVRAQEDKNFIMVFKIRPVKSLDELTAHRLEVAVLAKKTELANSRAPAAMGAVPPMTTRDAEMNGKGDLGNSLMAGGWSKAPMTHHQKLVFQVIKNFKDPGAHVDDIKNHLTEKISQADIVRAVDELMTEGHIYSSVDEYHFLSTESA